MSNNQQLIAFHKIRNFSNLLVKEEFYFSEWNFLTLLTNCNHMCNQTQEWTLISHFTCQDRHVLQCSEDWEIMWHQQKQTHNNPFAAAHTQTPRTRARTQKHIYQTHTSFFVKREERCNSFTAFKPCAASKQSQRNQQWARTETSTL